jgi:hypothetical protein
MTRHPAPPSKATAGFSITYGEYFKAITEFLSRDRFELLIKAAKQGFGSSLERGEIDEIRVFLMKHGEFYHPAKVEISFGRECIRFVVNVAVSETGRKQIETEFRNLKTLNEGYPYSFIPRVFGYGGGRTDRGLWVPMFLGEWFEEFYEFHYSCKPENQEPGLVVWDDALGRYSVDSFRTLDIFTRASAILTSYYDFFSSYHIASWHHAAGDFVANIQETTTTLKLITVRQYSPMVKMIDPDLGILLDALLLFFLNLSIQMRLDRLDGVREMVWAGEPAVKGTVKGFFSGLQCQISNNRIPEEVAAGFKDYLRSFKPDDLYDWCGTMTEKLFKGRPELELIQFHLKDHVHALHGHLAMESGS